MKSTVDQKLSKNKYILDNEYHISIDAEACNRCVELSCITACPAECFRKASDGKIIYAYEGCLECGTCRIVCPNGGVNFVLPRGGMGICYEFG